jgi:hypothetical protein
MKIQHSGKSRTSTDQSYFCGHCGQELTVQRNTSAEIILSANCNCSGNFGLDSRQDDAHGDSDVASFNCSEMTNDASIKLEILGEHDDMVDDLQLLPPHLTG